MSNLEQETGLEPLRVGEILDRSFRLLPKVWRPLLFPITLLSFFSAFSQLLNSYNQNSTGSFDGSLLQITLMVFSVIVAIILGIISTYLFYLLIDICSDAWLGKNVNLSQSLEKLTFKKALQLVMLGVFIMLLIGAIATILMIVYLIILFVLGSVSKYLSWIPLILLVPAILVFSAKVGMAFHVFLLEGKKSKESIKRSYKLMTAPKSVSWYSLSHPLLRWSGIYLVVLIISLFPNLIFPSIGGAVSTFGSDSLILSSIMSFPIYFISAFLGYIASIFGSLAYVGLYYDLRVRYEGFGLLSQD